MYVCNVYMCARFGIVTATISATNATIVVVIGSDGNDDDDDDDMVLSTKNGITSEKYNIEWREYKVRSDEFNICRSTDWDTQCE